jgi:hypothetical protein
VSISLGECECEEINVICAYLPHWDIGLCANPSSQAKIMPLKPTTLSGHHFTGLRTLLLVSPVDAACLDNHFAFISSCENRQHERSDKPSVGHYILHGLQNCDGWPHKCQISNNTVKVN